MNEFWAENDASKTERSKKSKKKEKRKKIAENIYIILYLHLSYTKILVKSFLAFWIHVPCTLQVTEGSSFFTQLLSIFVSLYTLTCLGTPDSQIPKGVLSLREFLPIHLLHSTEAGAEWLSGSVWEEWVINELTPGSSYSIRTVSSYVCGHTVSPYYVTEWGAQGVYLSPPASISSPFNKGLGITYFKGNFFWL